MAAGSIGASPLVINGRLASLETETMPCPQTITTATPRHYYYYYCSTIRAGPAANDHGNNVLYVVGYHISRRSVLVVVVVTCG
jgi:hypothetical protein